MKEKLNIKWLVIILVLIVSLSSLGIYGWAKYMTERKGNASAEIAHFNFTVTAGGEAKNLVIDLAETRDSTNIDSIDTKTVAPGTQGAVILDVNADTSDVSLKYNIDIDIKDVPQNLVFYTDEQMKNAIYYYDDNIHIEGFFSQDMATKSKTETLYWCWPMETGRTPSEIEVNDEVDSESMGQKITIQIKATGEQVREYSNSQECMVTFDINGGSIEGYGNTNRITKILNGSEQNIDIPSPTREGYTFVGWNVGGENLIKDKMSASGVWSTDISSVVLDASILDGDTRTILGRSGSFESYLFYMPKVNLNSKHKYFCSIEAKSNIVINYDANTIDIYWPAIVEPSLTLYDGNKITQANTWTKISGISSDKWSTAYSEYSGNYKVRYDFNNRYNEGSCTFRNPILIDLTETYGEGNEPTKEWCDNNIIYGETENITIPQNLNRNIVYVAVWTKD